MHTVLGVCLIAFAGQLVQAQQSAFVRTTKGSLEGETLSFNNGRVIVNSFRGIPYAKAPLRELRFKPPEEFPAWDGHKNAQRWSPRCPQAETFWSIPVSQRPESEDCLKLDVISPFKNETNTAEQSTKLAVLFLIHGGGFAVGASLPYGLTGIAANAVQRDFVVVSAQYRLGALGFFTTGDGHNIGNWAIWDLRLALQWTVNNIDAFGGDPQRITVVGYGAGATLASLLSVSPQTRDLFQQLIMLDAAALSPLTLIQSVHTAQASNLLALELQCEAPSTLQTADCLRTIELTDLREAVRNISARRSVLDMLSNSLIFGPKLDDNTLFPKSFTDLFADAPPKPTLIVYTSVRPQDVDALLNVHVAPAVAAIIREKTETMSYDLVRNALHRLLPQYDIASGRGFHDAPALTRSVLDEYGFSTGNKSDSAFLKSAFIKVLIDACFDVRSALHELVPRVRFHWPSWLLAVHPASNDLSLSWLLTKPEDQSAVIVWDIWAAFAKNGRPDTPHTLTSEWTAANLERTCSQLLVKRMGSTTVETLEQNKMLWFWTDLFIRGSTAERSHTEL